MNLELVDIDDIMGELNRRYDNMVFMGSRHLPDDYWDFRESQNGDRMSCLGMMQFFSTRLNIEMLRDMEEQHYP